MLIPNHPNDERLSALASRETDATADATLTAHVSSCRRCTDLVTELGALRAALADLPDLAPSRPLRLLPPVEAASAGAADRLGGWARRFFAPVLASGATLALVGTIGTAAPSLSGMAQSGAAPSEPAHALQAPAGDSAASAAAAGAPEAAASSATDEFAASEAPAFGVSAPASMEDRTAEDLIPMASEPGIQSAEHEPSDDPSTIGFEDSDQNSRETPTVERSPWPMVLFTGVALMIGAVLLRWILVPRAG